MRRFLSAICVISVLMLGACAPGNILSPNNNSAQEPTDEHTAARDTEIEVNPAPVGKDEPVKEKNLGVRPDTKLNSLGIEGVSENALSGKSLCLYIAEPSAFSAGELSEAQWLTALKDEYGVDVKYTLRNEEILYPAQAIAMRAGNQLDIITAAVTDGAGALSLIKSVTNSLADVNNTALPFSKPVFDRTGGRLISGKGCARVLWYNSDIIGDDMPRNLFKMDKWTQDIFASYVQTAESKQKKFIECDNWISFASTGSKQITGLSDTGEFLLSLQDNESVSALRAYSDIKSDKTGEQKFKSGGCAFKYTDAPGKQSFALGWAPLPKLNENGRYVAELCGRAVGISKTVSDDNYYAALSLAMLWSARYSQARSDALIYDYNLSEDSFAEYLEFCETNGGIYSFDKQINGCFEGESIPQTLYSDKDAIADAYESQLDRAQLINNRYI